MNATGTTNTSPVFYLSPLAHPEYLDHNQTCGTTKTTTRMPPSTAATPRPPTYRPQIVGTSSDRF